MAKDTRYRESVQYNLGYCEYVLTVFFFDNQGH